jgi:hypothetical protein
MTMTRSKIRSVLPAIALGAAMAALSAGCAEVAPATTPAAGTTAHAAPHIWDCGLVSSGSPSKYVCNGKVYTTFQLAKIRLDEIKQYESGK